MRVVTDLKGGTMSRTRKSSLKKEHELMRAFPGRLISHSKRILTLAITAWISVVSLVFLATVQPSAYALDFPMATHIALPDTASLTTQSSLTVALYSQLQTGGSISSSNELALVSFASAQTEAARTSTGAQGVARAIMATDYKWGSSQFGCLKTLWDRESHWNYKSHNYNSGAHGIAQALPAVKMETIALDWRTNPVTQIRWGLSYINSRYHSPCKALSRFKWAGYY